MRVLLTATLGRTIRQFLAEQIALLESAGDEVVIYTAAVEELGSLASGRDVRPAPWTRSLLSASTARSVWGTRRLLARDHFDVVYTHTAVASAVCRFAIIGLRQRPRVVYCAHGFDGAAAQPALRRTLSRLVERTLVRWTDLLFVMNDEDEQWARSKPYRKVSRVPSIGIDLDHYRRSAFEAVPAVRRYVVAIGELSHRKRFSLLVEAAAAIEAEVDIVIVGDGAERDALHALAQALGVTDRVRLVGHVDDPRPLIQGAVVTVSTSRQEGLPRSLLESAALEVPVVAVAARGVSDLVAAGIGRLVDSTEPSRLAQAIDELIADPLALEHYRAACRSIAVQHDVHTVSARMTGIIRAMP